MLYVILTHSLETWGAWEEKKTLVDTGTRFMQYNTEGKKVAMLCLCLYNNVLCLVV